MLSNVVMNEHYMYQGEKLMPVYMEDAMKSAYSD